MIPANSSSAQPQNLFVLRIDQHNRAAFKALLEEALRNYGCDSFPAVDTEKVDAFLKKHQGQRIPFCEQQASQDGTSLYSFYPAPRELQTYISQLQGVSITSFPSETTRDPFDELITVRVDKDGKIYTRLAALTDPDGPQIAVFHRQNFSEKWSIVHIYAMSEAGYLSLLEQHPLIHFHRMLRVDRWQGGILTVSRTFVEHDGPRYIPMHVIYPDGRVESNFAPEDLPEDRAWDKAQSLVKFLSSQAENLGRKHLGIVVEKLDFLTLLGKVPSRNFITKCTDRTNPQKDLGGNLYTRGSLLQGSNTVTQPLRLIPLTQYDQEKLWQLRDLLDSDDRFALALPRFTQGWLTLEGSSENATSRTWNTSTQNTTNSSACVITDQREGRLLVALPDEPMPFKGLLITDQHSGSVLLLANPSQESGTLPLYEQLGSKRIELRFLPKTQFDGLAAQIRSRPTAYAVNQTTARQRRFG